MAGEKEPKRALTPLEAALERVTGRSIEELRDISPEELRRQTEERFGKPMRVVSEYPVAEGRGHE